MGQKDVKINPDQQSVAEKQGKLRILVAPLDWGLGHATRCIPIIRELLNLHIDVWLAGEGAQEQLLKAEFPDLPFLPLQGYRVLYSRRNWGFVWKIILQSLKLYKAIREENKWLKHAVEQYNFDAVISDNRYGLYHSSVPCVFITHQLAIKSGAGNWTAKILQQKNYKYINRFSECWVPDTNTENNLAGDLSHPDKKPDIPIYYIGILSRFKKRETPIEKNHLLVILTGPEPQRSALEEKIIKQISHYQGTAAVVRGLPGNFSLIPSSNMLHFFNHLTANELNEEMSKAEFVISRSGYSTLMDLLTLQKKSILIPTPGQTEQEYLADYLSSKKLAFTVDQKNFLFDDAIQKAQMFTYHLPVLPESNQLHETISQFIATLR